MRRAICWPTAPANDDDPAAIPVPTNARAAFEKRLRDQVDSHRVLGRRAGPCARTEVSADFDFNRVTQTSDKYDPTGRVVRSSQTREETSATERRTRQSSHASATKFPAAIQRQQQRRPPKPAQRDQSRKSEEIVNYEISKTTKTEVIEGGRVNRVSVAVLVDGTYGKNDKGDITYSRAARKRSTRSRRWCALRSASIRSAAIRSKWSICASPRRRPIRSSSRAGWLSALPIHQGRHHARHRNGGHGSARLRRAAHGRAAAGAPRCLRRRNAPLRAAGGPAAAASRQRCQRAGRQSAEVVKAEPSQTAKMIDIAQVAGPGARPIRAKGRRTRRQESDRSRVDHPSMAQREHGLID